jgi:nucleotidyltransferase/DNA polymerase involved in DNA repair
VLASTEGVAAITAGGTVFGAIVIAVLAAWTAGRRQKRQLREDGVRQAAALAHDRELADLADLRVLLDEAAVALDHAVPAELVSLQLGSDARKLGTKRTIEDDARALDALHARLSVRMGPRHDITLSLGEATRSLRAIGNQIPRGSDALDAEALAERERLMGNALEGLVRCSEALVQAAVDRAGTVPTRDDPRYWTTDTWRAHAG